MLLLMLMTTPLLIASCGTYQKTEKKERTPVRYLNEYQCWCVPDGEMKDILKEATK